MDISTLDPITALGFILVFFLLSYATGWVNKVLDWLFVRLFGLAKRILIKTEHEMILYLHWMYRAARKGHEPKSPADCSTDDCVKIEH